MNRECLVVLGLAVMVRVDAQVPSPVTSDLWDVSRGTVVRDNSPVLNTSDPRNMFGLVAGSVEPGNTLFADGQPQGFVHYVEWETPLPNSLRSFALHAAHDGQPFDANRRGVTRFTLLAKDVETGNFDIPLFEIFPALLYEDTIVPPDVVFEADQPNHLRLCVNVPPVQSQEFRAEFVQWGPVCCFSGPRVFEIDGFDTPCPGSLVQISIEVEPVAGGTSIDCRDRRSLILVTLLSDDGFDATRVDLETVKFAGAPVLRAGPRSRAKLRYQPLPDSEEEGSEAYTRWADVDGDGDRDVLLFFSLRHTTLHCFSTEGVLTGRTFEGVLIESRHSVNLVPKGPRIIRVTDAVCC